MMTARLARLVTRVPLSPGVPLRRLPDRCLLQGLPLRLAVRGVHAALPHVRLGDGEGHGGGREPPWRAAALVPGAVAAVTVAAWSSACSDSHPACAPTGTTPDDAPGDAATRAADSAAWSGVVQGFLGLALRKSTGGGGAGTAGPPGSGDNVAALLARMAAFPADARALASSSAPGRGGGGAASSSDDPGGVVEDDEVDCWQYNYTDDTPRRWRYDDCAHAVSYHQMLTQTQGWHAGPAPWRLSVNSSTDGFYRSRDEALEAQARHYNATTALTSEQVLLRNHHARTGGWLFGEVDAENTPDASRTTYRRT